MGIKKPYHRNYRMMSPKQVNGGFTTRKYINHPDYAQDPKHYIRAFLIIQSDIINLFEFIEPSNINLKTYSFRIHELLMRTCIEVEANFKAILKENIYTKKSITDWNIQDYNKVNVSHHLDDYAVQFPYWKGENNTFKPFENWKIEKNPLTWYQAYNKSKHNRFESFENANFENLLNAFAGLFVLITSQFNTNPFVPGTQVIGIKTDSDANYNYGIGQYLKISFPTDWQEDEMYDFDWNDDLNEEEVKFHKFDYNKIKIL